MRSATKTAPLDTTIETFFATKTAGDVTGTMAFCSPDLVSCTDARLGSEFGGYDVLKRRGGSYVHGGRVERPRPTPGFPRLSASPTHGPKGKHAPAHYIPHPG